MAIATVTSKGQVTIPAPVRTELGLHAGSRLTFVRTGPGIYEIRSQRVAVRDLKGAVPAPARPVSIDEMDAAIAAGAAR